MTGYIYNGFGQYQKRGKETGIALTYGGVEFWLPYKKVTAIPDFNFREIDHAATAEAWEDGNDEALIYKVHRIPGARIVEELTEKQEPVKNREKGIIPVAALRDKLTDKHIKVAAGADEDGKPQYEEVRELKPSLDEITLAETLALEYKKLEIERYFQSKRDRMSGHQGYLVPTGLTKEFMKELGVSDIDQVSLVNQAKTPAAPAPAMDPNTAQEFLALLAQALMRNMSGDQAFALAQKAAGKVAESKKEKQPEEAFK